LGGPTLASILSRASKLTVEKVFSLEIYPKLYEEGYFAHSYNIFLRGYSPVDKILPQMWTDAEQYIDYLDAAESSPESPAAVRLYSGIKNYKIDIDISKLNSVTRRIIAAECSIFLEGTSTDLEIWQPYIRWARSMDKNHTIITFNYDRVLEMLAEIPFLEKIGKNSFVGLLTHDPELAKRVQEMATVI
jgi:hypothetical protein